MRYPLTYNNNDKAAMFFKLPKEYSDTVYRTVRSFKNNLSYYIIGGDKSRNMLYCIVEGSTKQITDIPYWELVENQCYVDTSINPFHVDNISWDIER